MTISHKIEQDNMILKSCFFFLIERRNILAHVMCQYLQRQHFRPVHSCETEQMSNPASVGDLATALAITAEAHQLFLFYLYAFLDLKLQKDRHINKLIFFYGVPYSTFFFRLNSAQISNMNFFFLLRSLMVIQNWLLITEISWNWVYFGYIQFFSKRMQ